MKTTNTFKTLLAMTAVASCSAGFAQQSNTFYGILDVGVENVSNIGPNKDSITRVPSTTNTIPSRLGVRGNLDLGDGYKAIYTAEMGIDPGNGTLGQGGRMFGRQAYIGLSTDVGTFTIGRQYTSVFWGTLDSDTLGGNIYGTGSIDSYIPNARADNSLAWTGKFNAWTLSAEYSFGRDTVNAGPSPAGTNCPGEGADSQACRQWSVMAKYETPDWGMVVGQDSMNGRNLGSPPDAIFGGLDSSSKKDTRQLVNGWFKMGTTKVGAGLVRRKNDGNAIVPDSDLWYVGASTPLTAKTTLAAQYIALNYSANSDYNSSLFAVRASYNLFKGTDLYAQVGTIQNNAKSAVSVSSGAPGSNPAAGNNQTAVNFAIRYTF